MTMKKTFLRWMTMRSKRLEQVLRRKKSSIAESLQINNTLTKIEERFTGIYLLWVKENGWIHLVMKGWPRREECILKAIFIQEELEKVWALRFGIMAMEAVKLQGLAWIQGASIRWASPTKMKSPSARACARKQGRARKCSTGLKLAAPVHELPEFKQEPMQELQINIDELVPLPQALCLL